jgi:uncharacterized membrane protein
MRRDRETAALPAWIEIVLAVAFFACAVCYVRMKRREPHRRDVAA